MKLRSESAGRPRVLSRIQCCEKPVRSLCSIGTCSTNSMLSIETRESIREKSRLERSLRWENLAYRRRPGPEQPLPGGANGARFLAGLACQFGGKLV